MEYKQLKENEINAGLPAGFIRRQVVTKCLRKENGAWTAKDAPFIVYRKPRHYGGVFDIQKGSPLRGAVERSETEGLRQAYQLRGQIFIYPSISHP